MVPRASFWVRFDTYVFFCCTRLESVFFFCFVVVFIGLSFLRLVVTRFFIFILRILDFKDAFVVKWF